MEKKTTDRRIRKTKNALKNGLTELMLEKSISDITVRELTDKVDINRGTFYLHYKDIFDLIEQLEAEMFEEMRNVFESHPAEDMNGQPLPLLEDIFFFLKENASLCTVLLSKNGDIAFVEKLKKLIREKCLSDWKIVFNKEKSSQFYYFCNYILAGCIGLIEAWLNQGMHESPKEMAVMTEQMILHGVNILK